MFSEAISEAYYAMFHAAKALLALRGIYPKTHAGVVSQFGLQFVTEGLIEELYAKSLVKAETCLLYTSPSPRDRTRSRMPSSA